MRRAVTATVCAVAIALPPANTLAAIRSTSAATATPTKTVITRKVSGNAAWAHDWGTVTVTLTVRKTTTVGATGKRTVTRRIVRVATAYEVRSPRSQMIMEEALPILRQEALAAQSATIDLVSGATDTSDAFVESLQAALVKARKV
jgi:uncharacterized protein with FMN-binding domain